MRGHLAVKKAYISPMGNAGIEAKCLSNLRIVRLA